MSVGYLKHAVDLFEDRSRVLKVLDGEGYLSGGIGAVGRKCREYRESDLGLGTSWVDRNPPVYVCVCVLSPSPCACMPNGL